MKYDENAGYFISHIRLLNARLFNKLLSEEENAKYSAEQGKILSALWIKNPQTATDISIKTGLANNTLSNMLKKLEEQGLIYSCSHENDQRKKLFCLTDEGKAQEEIGRKISEELNEIFYKGFSEDEKRELNNYLERALTNLQSASKRWKN
ncbi:MAG: MarR family winged helix-turn-helix transcriptional regulator [Catonella sp.]